MRLKGKTILITGAGAGLGKESARLFGEEGARLVLSDVNGDRLADVEKELQSQGVDCMSIVADVQNESDVAAAVDAAVDRFGQLDVMFANAGVKGRRQGQFTVDELTLEDWHDVHDVNLLGVLWSVKHAVRVMRPRRSGSILVTSSSAALRAYPGSFLYAATKGAVNSFVRTVAGDVGRFGIRVNAICPTHGMSPNFQLGTDGPAIEGSYEEVWQDKMPPNYDYPLKVGRPANLRDNAYAALFMVSDESTFITGVSWAVTDGGTMGMIALDLGAKDDGTTKYAWAEES